MRLDQALLQKQLVGSLQESQSLILQGRVLVNEQPVTKAGFAVKDTDVLRVKPGKDWVSRGAEKLKPLLTQFGFEVRGRKFFDIGSSHGGFTQVLLQAGAEKVVCVDVAYGFLHPLLRSDERVIVKERTNICDMAVEDLPLVPDAFVMDVSFIHPMKVLRHLKTLLEHCEGIVLFKPQFAAASSELEKGIIKETAIAGVHHDFQTQLAEINIEVVKYADSPVKGRKGNQETLYWLRW